MKSCVNLLSDSKYLASDLVNFSSDAAFAIDTSGTIVAWNDRARKLLGYSPAEVVGRFCGDVLQATLPGGEPLCRHNCDIYKCFLVCRPYEIYDCRMRHRDGGWVTASIGSVTMSERIRRLYADQVIAVIYLRTAALEPTAQQHRTLQVFTLGGFGISVAGRSIDIGKWKRKQAVTLLKYLVTHLDRPVHRERLLDSLWPDAGMKQGWERLKVSMYCLRRALRASGLGNEVIKTIDKAYMLRKDAVWVDVVDFERLVAEGRALQKQGRWLDALNCHAAARQLYRGDYLEEEPFADWCGEERERLREIYLEMLARTAECHAELGQYAEAEQICRKALVYDPCRGNLHHALMKYLLKNGRPDLALAQYRNCQRILEKEFGVAPLPEMQRLYQHVMKEGNSALIQD